MSVKILIDPFYVNSYPFHVVPRIFLPDGNGLGRLMGGLPGSGLGSFPRRAFGPEGFDGMDLGFSYTRLLRPDLSLREGVLSRYRRSKWPIHAFHATFRGGPRFFAETAMEISEDGERALRGLRSQIQAAGDIGGRGTILVIHLGVLADSLEASLRKVIRRLESVLPLAEDRGVILAAENMPRPVGGRYFLGADYRDLKRVLQALPSPFLRVCFDWGHANNYAGIFASQEGRSPMEGYLKGFGYCRELIQELGQDIAYAHIHYNRSHLQDAGRALKPRDEHMPLTRIPSGDWDAFCRTLQLLIEVSSIRHTRRINLELIPRRMFGFYSVFPTGSSRAEQMSSLKLLREILEPESRTPSPGVRGSGGRSEPCGRDSRPESSIGSKASD